MTIGQRKLLPDTETDKCPESCHLLCVDYYSEECAGNCCTKCPNSCDVPISPPPASSGKAMSTHLLVVACVLGGFFLVSICCIVVWKYCSKLQESGRRRRRRRSRPPVLGNNHEDFVDENHGPILDHPVWYIVTVGLPQSVIDSITVCKYRKGEGLIEGTECSICLGEFHEDESVRLLPKCSHAFHIPCIGTWLRSHKNCPLCRAPILSDGAPNELESREEEVVGEEIMGNYGEISSRRGREIDVLEETGELLVDFEAINGVSRKDLQNFEPGSDLVQNLLSVEQELEPVKRSVSLHSSSASLIYGDINALPVEGRSNIRMERMKRSNSKKEFRHGSGSTSLYRVMKSSSFRLPLQIRPISMKRSLSSNGSLIIQRQSRRQESVV